jgi:two-component system LytT family response regulator
MKTAIVDDERLARVELRRLLTAHPAIEICGEAANATAALALCARERPELLFLDVEMPGRNGFDLLEELPAPHPRVIFVTAFNAFALRAFEVNALDYLMKPVNPRRLAGALERVRGAGSSPRDPGPSDQAPAPLRAADRVFVRDGDRCWFVPVSSIPLLEAEGNHTRVHLSGASPLLFRTLVSMEERLPAALFLRANRSQLVNLAHIVAVEPWFSSSLKARLSSGREVEFSRRQAQVFRDRLTL